jgi:bacillithiol biosynthesis cysteine-adding enzyme BshC
MAIKKQKVSLSETGQFSKLIIDYINKDKKLSSFYKYEPTLDAFKQAIADKSKEQVDRKLLVNVLKNQYERLAIHPQVTFNLLLEENTYTVCTGHQLCLFTGPLYFIYKIISTINLAERLKKQYPSNNFLPVYWMASEDHDFEEISSINLFGKKVRWNNNEGTGAVGKLSTKTLLPVLEELKAIMGESAEATDLLTLFTTAYANHPNLADATRYLVHQLFSAYNLLIIDADDPELKESFSKIIKDDILNNTNYELVNNNIAGLQKIGVKTQVSPREINCFYMVDTIRERIELNSISKSYSIINTAIEFTKEELNAELKKHPERFSPNVVLRPLYQEKILPNLAYVGGPGEIAYWFEFKAMFDHHGISFPILMPRNFALLTDEKLNQQINKTGFSINDLFIDTDLLVKKYVSRNAQVNLSLQEEEKKLTNVYTEISEKALAIDATLKGSVEAEAQKAINALKNIESKLMRSEKQKQETGINQIKKIKEKLFPENSLQERYDNFIPYYLKLGKQFIPLLKENFDPFDFELLLLELDPIL